MTRRVHSNLTFWPFKAGSQLILFGILVLASIVGGCSELDELESGISGQMYCLCIPVIPPDWTPPPLEESRTIVVLDVERVPVKETMTDRGGRFAVRLSRGTYYIFVKDSPVREETGPIIVNAGEYVRASAIYHTAVR